jgi:surfeit locus 1 family protein
LKSSKRDLLIGFLVLVLAAGFIRLGFWQLDRHQQRVEENEAGRASYEAPALTDLSGIGPEDVYRRVRIEGVFHPAEEILVRSQVYRGSAGFHVVTPLILADGTGVMVNRGWVPLVLDSVPVVEAAPPTGETVVEGWVEPSRQRPTFGPEDPGGDLSVMSRIDIPRIQEQVGVNLAPVYVVMTGGGGVLPEPVEEPGFTEEGPHLGYAIQWFGFAAIALVGLAVVRRKSQKARPSTTSYPASPES